MIRLAVRGRTRYSRTGVICLCLLLTAVALAGTACANSQAR